VPPVTVYNCQAAAEDIELLLLLEQKSNKLAGGLGCAQNAALLIVKANGTYSYHSALQGQKHNSVCTLSCCSGGSVGSSLL
jgi:hypothetical protein